MAQLSGYELSKDWFDFSFENPELINPTHTALYFFAIEHCNRLGWKEKFGMPTQMAMDAIGVKNWRTYSKAFNDLVEWGFFKLIEKSKNQYSATVIAIVKNTKANTKALTKARQKHVQKHSSGIAVIDKPNNYITKEPNNPDDKSSPDFIQQLILQFQEVYLQSRDLEYVITNKGKERTATSKLLNLYKSKNPQSDTKQTLEDLNKYFHACINISDNWLYENMSLPIIINQFNKINNILRNGKKTKSGANWQEVAGFIARDFG